MKTKSKLIFTMLFFLMVPTFINAHEIPPNINYQITSDGLHKYTIKNINVSKEKAVIPTPRFTDFEDDKSEEVKVEKYTNIYDFFCEVIQTNENYEKVEINIEDKMLILLSKRKIDNLKEIINSYANMASILPYWDEMLNRERKSKEFKKDLYKLTLNQNINMFGQECSNARVKEIKKLNKNNVLFCIKIMDSEERKIYLAEYILRKNSVGEWEFIQKDKKKEISITEWWKYTEFESQLGINYSNSVSGQLKINRSLNYCMCHDRYALRIFDDNNKYIWENLKDIYGTIFSAVIDIDEDGIDEIIVYITNHGKNSLVIFTATKPSN